MATALGLGVNSILGKSLLKGIEDPMSRGIGASVNQNQSATKATNTVKTSTSNTKSSPNISGALSSPLPAERLSQEIFGTSDKNYVSTLVDEMLDATVNKKIADEIKKGRLSLQQSDIYKTYSTAVAYYKKLYDGTLIMTELRNKTEKNISKLINQRINDKIFAWEKNLPEWQRMLLAKSKLMSSLTSGINAEIKNAIGSIFTDKMISGINDALIGNLKKINESITSTITTQFKNQIAEVVKLRSVIQEKIKAFAEMKRQYEQKIYNAIQKFKDQIAKVVSEFTQKLVSTLSGAVKNLASGLTGAIKI